MTRTELLRLLAGAVWVLAIAMIAAERRIVRTLQRAAATGPDTAAPIALWSPLVRWRLARLRSGGAVVATTPGRFYLDPDGFQRYRQRRRRRALIVMSVVFPLVGILWWLNR